MDYNITRNLAENPLSPQSNSEIAWELLWTQISPETLLKIPYLPKVILIRLDVYIITRDCMGAFKDSNITRNLDENPLSPQSNSD